MRAQILREWRSRVGLTQAQASSWFDYSDQTRYSRFERNIDGHDTSRRYVVALIRRLIESGATVSLPTDTKPCLAALAGRLGAIGAVETSE